jgi:Flp pilus assembly protein TadD
MRRLMPLLALCLSACGSARGEEKWIKLSTPHFEMFTPNGEKRAKEALLQFEQVRTFFRQATQKPKDSNLYETRVRIVAFRGEKDYKPYRMNEGAAAFYLKNESHDYIVMGDLEEEHFEAAAHEYTHLVVQHAGLKFPLWLNEGLADVYSTLEPHGDKTTVGKPSKGRVLVLLHENWLNLPSLFSVGRDSPYYNEKDKMSIFYAESWMLTHMLMLSEPYAMKFPQFLSAVNRGAGSEDALRTVYGKDVGSVMVDLRHYISSGSVPIRFINVKLEKSDLEPEVTTPGDLDLRLTLADILVGLRRLDPAKEVLTRLSTQYADQPQVEETWFDLAWQSRDVKTARSHCERAFTLGSKNVQMLNNCMALEYQAGASEILLPMLQRVADLQPEDSSIHVRLGLELVNERKFGLALAQFAQVTSVKPEMAYSFYSAAGYAKFRLGDTAESRKDWELAKKYAQDDTQVQMAERFLADLAKRDAQKNGAAPRSAQPAEGEEPAPVFTSDSRESDDPVPPGLLNRLKREDQLHADGVLTHIDCEGQGWRLHLKTASGDMIFFIASANDIVVTSSDDAGGNFTFSCGTPIGKNATVYYVVKADMPSVTGVARRLVLTK